MENSMQPVFGGHRRDTMYNSGNDCAVCKHEFMVKILCLQQDNLYASLHFSNVIYIKFFYLLVWINLMFYLYFPPLAVEVSYVSWLGQLTVGQK